MARQKLIVIKRPRSSPIPDIPIKFPPFENLHLELLENKKKVREGAPIPKAIKRDPPKLPKDKFHHSNDTKPSSKKGVSNNTVKDVPSKKKAKTTPPPSKDTDLESDILNEFGDEDGEHDALELEFGDEEEIEEPEEGTEGEEEFGDDEGEIPEEDDTPEEDDPYAGLTPEEREEKEKQEYIWRFYILKKQYQKQRPDIPTFNEHSDLTIMKTTYDRTVKELYLDDAVESYKTYLVGGFIVMEYVCTQYIGIDLGGFAIQQAKMMYKYDRMLIELGEKSYGRWGTNLPVEVRLIGMILMNAGIFYLGKIITSKFGTSISELFNGMNGLPPQSISDTVEDENPEKPKKKRMRGPSIKIDDLKNMQK